LDKHFLENQILSHGFYPNSKPTAVNASRQVTGFRMQVTVSGVEARYASLNKLY
jgi:hypothetical protein